MTEKDVTEVKFASRICWQSLSLLHSYSLVAEERNGLQVVSKKPYYKKRKPSFCLLFC
jgi:hypothetical protein